MLSPTLSSSISSGNFQPAAEDFGGNSDKGIGELELCEEPKTTSDEVTDSGTLFADILERFTHHSPETSTEMSSDSDEDMLDFLQSKKFLKRKNLSQIYSTNVKQSTNATDDRVDKKGQMVSEGCGEIKLTGRKRTTCMNKNAINARLQREKKKQYVSKLEEKLHELEMENQTLKSHLSDRTSQIDHMRSEISYLKSVIANHTSLSSLLRHIPVSKDMQFGSSISPLVERCITENGNDSEGQSRKRRRVYDSDSSVKDKTSNERKGVYVVTTAKVPQMQQYESLLHAQSLKNNPVIPEEVPATSAKAGENKRPKRKARSGKAFSVV